MIPSSDSGDMNDPDPASDKAGSNSVSRRRPRWYLLRLAAMVIGLLMLTGAIVLIVKQHDRIAPALQAMSHPSLGTILILILSMLAGLFLTGLQFQLLMARHRIPAIEMQGLIAASALLNFLPLKAGLLGRIAYHQVSHGVHPMETAKVMILARVSGLVIIALTAGSLFLQDWTAGPLWAWAIVPAAVPGWFIMPAATRTAGLVMLLKYMDLLLMAIRYRCAFHMMDQPIGFEICLALAAIGMLAGAIPFLSGGLGLREWMVGWLATILVMLPAALEIGILADLVNRATELVVLIPVGGIALFWLRPRFASAMRDRRAQAEQTRATATPNRSQDPAP